MLCLRRVFIAFKADIEPRKIFNAARPPIKIKPAESGPQTFRVKPEDFAGKDPQFLPSKHPQILRVNNHRFCG